MKRTLIVAAVAALGANAAVPLGGLARQLYSAHSKAGHGGEDFSSILKLLTGEG